LSWKLGLGGPVGLFHASLGFSSAIFVARVWESVAHEDHCSLACPNLASQALQLHHFYYGVGLLTVSMAFLSMARRQRVRWDSSLFLGIGTGLLADEVGLLLLGVPYASPLSILIPAVFAGTFFLGTINAALRDGIREFQSLDISDSLTIVAILLGLVGVLYLDRPLVPLVQVLGALSWVSALTLMITFGGTHFRRTLVGPG
jgi:hypothetical protein